MNRRQFARCGTAAILCELLPHANLANPAALPWTWIATNLAAGIVSGIGSKLFTTMSASVFRTSQKSLEQLLREQLEEFAQIVQGAIVANEARRYGADAEAYFHLYREYSRTPTLSKLEWLQQNTEPGLTNLASLKFVGYRTYLSAVSLRLSILQEAKRQGLAKARDFQEQVEIATANHRQVIAVIDADTNPAAYVQNNHVDGRYEEPTTHKWYCWVAEIHNKNILGRPVGLGLVPVKEDMRTPFNADEIANLKALLHSYKGQYDELNDKIIDFGYVNRTVKAENTDVGEKVIEQWNQAAKNLQGPYVPKRIEWKPSST